MTNETSYAPIKYLCNGVTVDFVFPWKIFEEKDLIVQIQDSDGNITDLVLGVDYNVEFDEVGGNVKLNQTYAEGDLVVISRNVPDYQSKSFSTSSGFQASEVEESLDRVSCNLQEMEYSIENFKGTFSKQTRDEIDELENLIDENKQEVLLIQERFEDEVDKKIVDLKADVDSKVADVANAADKINALDESIALCQESAANAETQANNAATQAQIAAEKTKEILNVKDELEAEIETRANTSLDNLTETGEKHFLGKTNITNCITSAPQRIKYSLVNGILTIFAGSVILVPYGTEDKTAEYPIGSTFIHENFKVYNRQYSDGKFFVWAELQNDITTDTASSLSSQYYFSVNLTTGEGNGSRHSESGTSKTATNTYTVYYNSNTHLVNSSEGTTSVTADINSFPIITGFSNGTYYYGTIERVFQYTGHIGLTTWVDKGVKGLTASGKNNDGTLINEEWETSKVELREIPNVNTTRMLALNPNRPLSDVAIGSIHLNYFKYIEELNRNYDLYPEGVPYEWKYTPVATIVISNGKITDFISRPILNILSYSNKSEICGWGHLSNKYINFVVGATRTKYTAPANGWFNAHIDYKSAADNWVMLFNHTDNPNDWRPVISRESTSGTVAILYPVKAGQELELQYSTKGTIDDTRKFLTFWYAEGEV